MLVYSITLGKIIPTNTYFYIDEKTKSGIIIDPADEAEKLLQVIAEKEWKIEKILLTHGHFDHIGAVQALYKNLQIPYYIHERGEAYLQNPAYNLSSAFREPIKLGNALYLKDNDVVTLQSTNGLRLKVIYTPGHTLDSCVYYDEKRRIAFVGDTIFKNSVGRTDLPGGDESLLRESIEKKIFTLPSETVLYSGHSVATTVENEKY